MSNLVRMGYVIEHLLIISVCLSRMVNNVDLTTYTLDHHRAYFPDDVSKIACTADLMICIRQNDLYTWSPGDHTGENESV